MRSVPFLVLAAAIFLPPVLPLAAQSPSASPSPTASPTPRPSATPTPTPPRTEASAVTPNNRNPFRHAQFLYRIKEGPVDLLFLGDSITDKWPRDGEWTWERLAHYHPADFGVGGEQTEDLLWRITNGELDGISPKVVVLMIGTNNIGQHKDEKLEWTVAGIRKNVDTIREKLPHTRVLLLGVFPRGDKTSPQRARVDAINAQISRFDDGQAIRYLDIGHVFLDGQGEIPKDIMGDALHPTAKGYELWYDAMSPLLDEMMNSK